MQTTSVSNFKARTARYLRAAERGETIIITDRCRPLAEVRAARSDRTVYEPAGTPFSSSALEPLDSEPGLWKELNDEDRGLCG